MFQVENFQFKRSDKAGNDAYVGPAGSISIDRETESIRIHDGITPGGLFRLTRGADFDAEMAEFITVQELHTLADGQTVITLTNVDETLLDRTKVKVNGILTNDWSVTGPKEITITEPTVAGDVVLVYNYKTLADLVAEAVGGTDISTTIQDLLDAATHIGGIELAALVNEAQLNGAIANVMQFLSELALKVGDPANLGTSDKSNLVAAINEVRARANASIPLAEKAQPNGVATLDAGGFIPAAQLPSFVDSIEEVSALPTTGVEGKIYVLTTDNTQWRWSGSQWVQISSSLGIADEALKLSAARNITLDGDASGTVAFDGSQNVVLTVTVSGISGGVAASATKLETARQIELTGGVTGSASFDGSQDVQINAVVDTTELLTVNDTIDLGVIS